VLVATMVAHTATSLHRGVPVARVGEVQAKAWTTTSADATPSLEASFLHLLASARRVLQPTLGSSPGRGAECSRRLLLPAPWCGPSLSSE